MLTTGTAVTVGNVSVMGVRVTGATCVRVVAGGTMIVTVLSGGGNRVVGTGDGLGIVMLKAVKVRVLADAAGGIVRVVSGIAITAELLMMPPPPPALAAAPEGPGIVMTMVLVIGQVAVAVTPRGMVTVAVAIGVGGRASIMTVLVAASATAAW